MVAASERVNVMLAVSPAVKERSSDAIWIVGAVVSRVSTVMFTEAAAVLASPSASVNVPAATETTPSVVLLSVGVKVAV